MTQQEKIAIKEKTVEYLKAISKAEHQTKPIVNYWIHLIEQNNIEKLYTEVKLNSNRKPVTKSLSNKLDFIKYNISYIHTTIMVGSIRGAIKLKSSIRDNNIHDILNNE